VIITELHSGTSDTLVGSALNSRGLPTQRLVKVALEGVLPQDSYRNFLALLALRTWKCIRVIVIMVS
jgi:hypothetical protein